MNSTEPDPFQLQEELLPGLLEGKDPDLYVVIPVDVLSRQLMLDWHAVAREHRGEVRDGWLQFRLLRSLKGLGVLINTKPGRLQEPKP